MRDIVTVAPWNKITVRLAILIFGVAFLLYARAIPFGYAWDDAIVVTENARVQQGFAGLPSHWVKHNSERLQDHYGYRPVVMTTFGIEYGLFGANPHISHAVNAWIYGLLCLLVFVISLRLLPARGPWLAAAAALLFTVHPLHVEAVANIKSRDELMAFAFALLSFWLLLRYYDGLRIRHLIGSLLAFAAAFLSKESAVATLPVMGLSILMQAGGWRKKAAFLLPIPIVALVAMLVLQWSLTSTLDIASTQGAGIFEESLGFGNPMLGAPNLDKQLPTASALFLRYAKEFFWPWPLVYYSGHGQGFLSDWESPIVGLSLSFVGWWLVLALASSWRTRVPAYSWLLFVSYFAVYGHFFRPLADLMADRFMLGPSLGLSWLVVWVLSQFLWIGRKYDRTAMLLDAPKWRMSWAAWLFWGILLPASAIFGYRSWTRIPAWRDNLTLFSTDIAHLDDCSRCHAHYAGALLQQYQQRGGNASELQRIEREYQRAIALNPLAYNARLELAQFYYNQNRFPEGVAAARGAVQQFPEQVRPRYWLGKGEYFMQRFDSATVHLQQAWDGAPLRDDAPYMLAWTHYMHGQPADAILLARLCIARYPQSDQFPDALSDFLFGTGQVQDGLAVLKAGIARFHSPLLYRKMIQRHEEGKQAAQAELYRAEARELGIDLNR